MQQPFLHAQISPPESEQDLGSASCRKLISKAKKEEGEEDSCSISAPNLGNQINEGVRKGQERYSNLYPFTWKEHQKWRENSPTPPSPFLSVYLLNRYMTRGHVSISILSLYLVILPTQS